MALTYRIEIKPEFLLMTYEGHFESSDTDPVTSQIQQAYVDHKATRVLVDVRKVSGIPTFFDRFDMGEFAARKYFLVRFTDSLEHCRFAVLGHEPFIDPGKFAQIVAVNRGLDAKVFTEMEDAVLWLKEKIQA
jgi:hypothetical protein